ncbi:TPA: hypothetical protein ENS27_07880 [bacterium]|nr:hypothetical protein [bacterium]
MKKTNIEELEKQIEQLPPTEQLKLIARICQKLSGTDISVSEDFGIEKADKKKVAKYLLEYPQ